MPTINEEADIYLDTLTYYKTEIDEKLAKVVTDTNTGLALKPDNSDKGSPGGIATLDGSGDVDVIQIPFALQSETEDDTNTVKVINPEQLHYALREYEKEVDADAKYGDYLTDGSRTMSVAYNPQEVTDLATVKYVQEISAGAAQNYVVDTLAEMLVLPNVNLADTCFVVADATPTNNAEYRALQDDPVDIGDWAKLTSDIAWGALIGTLSDQTDLQVELDAKGSASLVNTHTSEIAAIEVKTDYITVTAPVNLDSAATNVAANAADIVLIEADIVSLETDIGNLDNLTTTTKVDLVVAVNEVDTTANANTASIAAMQGSQNAVTMNDMTGSEPATTDGQFYYANNCLNMGNAYGTNLQIGQEIYTEVANASGAMIPEGTAVYQMGVSGGLPAIGLALADNYGTSIVIGITTMDIADGATGLITTFGNVNGLNTNGIATDVLVYLSDVVAGGMTTIAPDIATVIGTVLLADLTSGIINVRIRSNIALPTIFAGIKGATLPAILPADLINPIAITSYSNSIMVVMTADAGTGEIHCSVDGIYRSNISLDMSFTNVGGAGKKEIYLGVRNVTTNTLIDEIHGFILKDAETHSFSSNALVDLVAGNSYRLELRSEIALNNLSFSQSNFDLESVHIR